MSCHALGQPSAAARGELKDFQGFIVEDYPEMYRRVVDAVLWLLFSIFGARLCRCYGNEKVQRLILWLCATFNSHGAAVIFPKAPWFGTYEAGEEEDCLLHPYNYDPVSYFRARGWHPFERTNGRAWRPWWERLRSKQR